MDTPPTILIVDDDREIRTLLAEYLESNGFRALAAADGAGMRRILDSSHVDLVVLDLTLPGEDGLTLCRTLRAASNLPVIMLTARGEPLDRILGLEMGADDYVAKPFEPRELSARIRNVLRRTQALIDCGSCGAALSCAANRCVQLGPPPCYCATGQNYGIFSYGTDPGLFARNDGLVECACTDGDFVVLCASAAYAGYTKAGVVRISEARVNDYILRNITPTHPNVVDCSGTVTLP